MSEEVGVDWPGIPALRGPSLAVHWEKARWKDGVCDAQHRAETPCSLENTPSLMAFQTT